MKTRKLDDGFVFDHRIADCEKCSLLPERDKTICLAYRPEDFNGIMIVGEGPGVNESQLKVPFVGMAGRTLDRLLKASGIKREQCYLTNSTLCLPPRGSKSSKGGLVEAHPTAVSSCRGRLLTEIATIKPRVILALGSAALHSLLGYEEIHNKWVANPCTVCNGDRQWKHWICAKCETSTKITVGEKDANGEYPSKPVDLCACGGKFKPKIFKCEACGGKKRVVESYSNFKCDYTISFAAGGLFKASNLPIAEYISDPERTYVIPTFHPSYINRKIQTTGDKQIGGQYLANAVVYHFSKALRLLDSDPDFNFDWFKVNADNLEDPRLKEFEAFDCFAVDIETDQKDTYDVTDIRCIGIGPASLEHANVAVFDTSHCGREHPTVERVCRFLSDPSKKKIFQNGIYDCECIKRIWGVDVAGYEEDTLIAHNALAPDEPHKLHNIGFCFTDAEPWKPTKHDADVTKMEAEELWKYNALDVRVTAISQIKMREEMRHNNVRAVHDLDVKKFHLAMAMREYGMPVDREKMLQVGATAKYRAEMALKRMREIVGQIPQDMSSAEGGRDFNPQSIRQLAWALFAPFGPLKFTPTRFTEKSQTPSTDKNALLDHADSEFVQCLTAYRDNKNIHVQDVDNIVLGADMRLHPRWNPIGARTGRWTSSPNVQNRQKWVRSMYAVPDGRKIVGADFAQIELRIIAALSGDLDMINRCIYADESQKLDPDHDPHSFIAAASFGTAFTGLSMKDPNHDKANVRCACETCARKHLRDVAKRTIYGLGYGAGAATVREAIYDGGYNGPPITVQMVERITTSIFTKWSRIPQWRREIEEKVARDFEVTDAIVGRRRVFPLGEADSTVVYNYPCQATAAAILDISALEFHALLPEIDSTAGIICLVHDAIYAECAEDKAEQVAELLEKSMRCEIELTPGATPMPIPATAAIANNWKDAG